MVDCLLAILCRHMVPRQADTSERGLRILWDVQDLLALLPLQSFANQPVVFNDARGRTFQLLPEIARSAEVSIHKPELSYCFRRL